MHPILLSMTVLYQFKLNDLVVDNRWIWKFDWSLSLPVLSNLNKTKTYFSHALIKTAEINEAKLHKKMFKKEMRNNKKKSKRKVARAEAAARQF